MLTQLYNDLSSRSRGLSIDKSTFMSFFLLPGLWGERLFSKFGTKGTGTIDFDEFLTGISI
jgi:Ca2+-binding EF-hand superfamily protein